jgi:nardilysin
MQLHIEGLCHGNLSEEEAINISKIFCNTLSAQTLPEEARHGERVICIPNGENFVRSVRVKNDLEENSVVEVGYYPGATILHSSLHVFFCRCDLKCLIIW